MSYRTHTYSIILLSLAILGFTACAKRTPAPAAPPAQTPTVQSQPREQAAEKPTACPPAQESAAAPQAEQEAPSGCLECQSVDPKLDRGGCFKLQAGKTTKDKKGRTVTGRCQPQCIPYARCRSGIRTCQLGDTSPVGWFQCARKNKNTTSTPRAGSIMVIDVNKRRNMPTGHLGFVEEACPNADGTWTLRFSHTNYDRKCHLDLDAKVLFHPKTMEADFLSGPWKTWAKGLKICGFILR